MTVDDQNGRSRHVAVGATRQSAARCFARGHDDLMITTYDDLPAETDLHDVRSLSVTLGPGAEPVLREAARQIHAGADLALLLAVTQDDADSLPDLLDDLGLTVGDLDTDRDPVLLRLSRRTGAAREHDELVLRALLAPAPRALEDEPSSPLPSTGAPAQPRERGAGRAPRPVPRLLEVLGQVRPFGQGRRRLAVLAGTATGVVLLVALGVLLRDAGVLLAVAVPVLLLAVAASGATTCYVALLLARQVHVQTGRLERMTLHNRDLLRRRTAALNRRLSGLERSQARFPFTQAYLESLAALGAETSARVHDLGEAVTALSKDDRPH